MHDKVYIFRHVFFKSTSVYFSIQGNHPAFLCVDCCFDITIKNSIMITNSWDDVSLYYRTVVFSYKQV